MVLKRFLFLGLTLILSSAVFAGEADDLLKKSAETFRQAQGWSFLFELESGLQGEAPRGTAKGTLIIGSGDRFRLEMPGQQVISDGVTLWQYNPTRAQVLIRNVADQKDNMHPSEALFRYLKCKPISVVKVQMNGESVHHMKLDPKGQIKGYTQMEVWLRSSDLTPIQIVAIDKSGTKNLYRISQLKKNPPLSKDSFRFIAPADVDEVDMR